MPGSDRGPDRRRFIKQTLQTAGLVSLGTTLTGAMGVSRRLDFERLKNLGGLQKPDALGVRLLPGFRCRLLARSGRPVLMENGRPSSYIWHHAPDGGACFPGEDGGWIYVSNSEVTDAGGAGAIRFNRRGGVKTAYSILKGTSRNCSGGPTPWGTWLSCEETETGQVYECDVHGGGARVRPALGRFRHEAVAIDPQRRQAYLTEDKGDGCLYRFTAEAGRERPMDLDRGVLEVALMDDSGRISWRKIPDPVPGPGAVPVRLQVEEASRFPGAEGIWFHRDKVVFACKGDNRVWELDVPTSQIQIIYDGDRLTDPVLSGVDNLCVSDNGQVVVAEDGDDMQVVMLGPNGEALPLLQVVDQDHSEITGPAISPDGRRLYFSSQRGGPRKRGLTYEVSGPFGFTVA